MESDHTVYCEELGQGQLQDNTNHLPAGCVIFISLVICFIPLNSGTWNVDETREKAPSIYPLAGSLEKRL